MANVRKHANWRAWAVGILVGLVVITALQNSQQVRIDVLTANAEAPLIVVILASVVIGMLIGYSAPIVLRHRRSGLEQRKSADS